MNRQHFTDTFTRLRTRLRDMAAAILKNDDAAEDALQEAFCRLWSRNDLTDTAPGDGLAVMAVKNVCVDFLRRQQVRQADSIDSSLISDLRESRSLWEEEEMQEFSCHIMNKLTEIQRSVFEMVSNGMDYDVVALRLGISESAVRQHMCRARKTLRNEYKKWQGNG